MLVPWNTVILLSLLEVLFENFRPSHKFYCCRLHTAGSATYRVNRKQENSVSLFIPLANYTIKEKQFHLHTAIKKQSLDGMNMHNRTASENGPANRLKKSRKSEKHHFWGDCTHRTGEKNAISDWQRRDCDCGPEVQSMIAVPWLKTLGLNY